MLKGSDVTIITRDEATRFLSLIRVLAAGVNDSLDPWTKEELNTYASLDASRLMSELESILKEASDGE